LWILAGRSAGSASEIASIASGAFVDIAGRADGAGFTAVVFTGWKTVGSPFVYTSANWGDSWAFFHEAFVRATAGTAQIGLLDRSTGNLVPGSIATTTASVLTVIRSIEIELTDGHEYQTQLGADGAGAGSARSSKIVAVGSPE